jgi:type VI secretion system secreted protein VgrG
MKIQLNKVSDSVLVGLVLVMSSVGINAQGATISLGRAESFAVLAASTVTNTNTSVITGDVGVSAGSSAPGITGANTSGTIQLGTAQADWAHTDALAAYNQLAGLAPLSTLDNQLGGVTLTPGVYNIAVAQLTGLLTLDGAGMVDPLFVFLIGDTLTTASNSSILLINGATATNLFFKVGSSATLGTGTQFAGNIISLASNTLTSGASVDGRVIALNGAVTLDGNRITAVPEPAGALLLAPGLLSLLGRRRSRSRK